MSIDEQHVALPKLYGAPAYARAVAPVATVPRPLDPDDLPIEAFMSEEERAYAASLPARAWAPGGGVVGSVNGKGGHEPGNGGHGGPGSSGLRPRQFNLRAIAGKLLNGG